MKNITKKGKTVICPTTGKEFNSALEAAHTYNLKPHSVYAVCLGRQKMHNGYEFYYEESVPHKMAQTNDLHEQLKEALAEVETAQKELERAQKKCARILKKLGK